MKYLAGLFVLAILIVSAYAEEIKTEFSNSYDLNALKVSRELDTTITKEFNTATRVDILSYDSTMKITVRNNGLPIKNVIITENISLYENPSFDPEPTEITNDTAIWKVDFISADSKYRIEIGFKSKMDNSTVQSMLPPTIEYGVMTPRLLVPEEANTGEELNIIVTNDENQPMEVELTVTSPDGKHTNLETDENGKAVFTPSKDGAYEIAIKNTNISKQFNAKAIELTNNTLTTAAMSTDEVTEKAWGILPVLVILVVIAAVLFGVIVMYAPRRPSEEEKEIDSVFAPKVDKPMDINMQMPAQNMPAQNMPNTTVTETKKDLNRIVPVKEAPARKEITAKDKEQMRTKIDNIKRLTKQIKSNQAKTKKK